MTEKQQKSVIMENRQEKNKAFVSFRIYLWFQLLQDHHDYKEVCN